MNQIQQRQYTGKGGIYQQLTLPISEIILIDELEPVYVANAQLEELDYRKLYQTYSLKRKNRQQNPGSCSTIDYFLIRVKSYNKASQRMVEKLGAQ